MQRTNNQEFYFSLLSRAIKAKDVTIRQISNMEIIGLFNLDRNTYPELISLIKNGRLEEAKARDSKTERTFEDLTVIRFNNEIGNSYVAVFYDSDELWQDPVLWELFRSN